MRNRPSFSMLSGLEPIKRGAPIHAAKQLMEACGELIEESLPQLHELRWMIRYAAIRGKLTDAEYIQEHVTKMTATFEEALSLFKILESEIGRGLRSGHLGILQLLLQTIADAEKECVEFSTWCETLDWHGSHEVQMLLSEIEDRTLGILVKLSSLDSLHEWLCAKLVN